MYGINDTTDKKFLGRKMELPQKDDIIQLDDFAMRIDEILKVGNDYVIFNPNYIITLKELIE